MSMNSPLNEYAFTSELDKLLDSDEICKFVGLTAEMCRTHPILLEDLQKTVCGEKDWSVKEVNDANAFHEMVEREYVLMHVGEKTCSIRREFAQKIVALVTHDQAR